MKYYTRKQALEEIKKSLYKAYAKSMKKYSKLANQIVEDILDDNEKPEVAGKKIPPAKQNVMYKSRKGIEKLKKFTKKCK